MAKEGKVTVKKTVEKGVGFGSALAIVMSYVHWQSVGWAIIHGILGWVYVVYHILKYGFAH